MENKKQLSQEQMIAQITAQMNREFELKQQQREENRIMLGARVMDLVVLEGNEKKDKETGQPKVDNNGQVLRYPNKYKVTLQFMGGELEQEVSSDIYDSLEIHKMYYCIGRLGEVSIYGETAIRPIFTQFTKI